MRLIFLIFLTFMLLTEKRRNEYNTQAECRVEFQILNAGIQVTGILEEVSAEIHFDPKKLDASTIIAKAKPKDIRTGIPIRDKHLQRSDYFDSDKFPEINLISTSFKKAGRNSFVGTFKLTIKNISSVIMIPFSITHEGNATIYTGSFEINRLDFRLGEESLILDKKVNIIVKARLPKE